MDISRIWVLGGAVLPALLGAYASFPDSRANRFVHSSLLSLSTVVLASFEFNINYLSNYIGFLNQKLGVLQLLIIHFGTVVFLAWLFQIITPRIHHRIFRGLSIGSILCFALLISAHAVLLDNYFY